MFLHLFAVLMIGAVLFEKVDSCLRNAPPVDQWDGEELSDLRVDAERGETLTAAMSDYVFHCNGTISQWRLQWYLRSKRREQCTVTLTFYTLRPEAGSDCIFTPVGNNTMTLRTGGHSSRSPRLMENTFNISVEDRYPVQAGDSVGLGVEFDRNCHDDTFWISGMDSTNSIVYYETLETDDDETSSRTSRTSRTKETSSRTRRSNDETSSRTRSDDETSSRTRSDDETSSRTRSDDERSSQTRFHGNVDICSFRHQRELLPYITAVIEPLSEATPTSIHPKETSIQESMSGSVKMTRRINFSSGRPAMAGADDSGGNMVILTSVGASVGVLLVVAAALTAVLCVWQCSKKRTSQSAPENTLYFAVVENEAYGVHRQQQEARNGGRASDVALEKLQQIKMEENEAYNVHTHHSQDADLNGYYDTVEYTEEEGNDYVTDEPVYDLPS